MEITLKTKSDYFKTNNPNPGHISGEEHNFKRNMHPSVRSSTIYNSQNIETT